MSEYLRSAIGYGEFVVAAAVWIGLCCIIVAGVERVLFSIIARRPPEKFVEPSPIVDLPHLREPAH
jgi:hypothetical protein